MEQPGGVTCAHPDAPVTGVPSAKVTCVPRRSMEKLAGGSDPHRVLHPEVVFFAGADHLIGHPCGVELVHDQLDAAPGSPAGLPTAHIDAADKLAIAID